MNKYKIWVLLLLFLPVIVVAQTALVENQGPHNLADLYNLNVPFGSVSWKWSALGNSQQTTISNPSAFEIPNGLCKVRLYPKWTCPDGTVKTFSPLFVDLSYVASQNANNAVVSNGIAREQLIDGEFTNGSLGLEASLSPYLFYENFELGSGDDTSWTSTNGTWVFDNQAGASSSLWNVDEPGKYAPESAFVPGGGVPNTKSVGTMSCSYRRFDDDWLKSPMINIPDQGVNTPILTFKTWYESEYYYDQLEVYISVNGGTYTFADAMVGSKSKDGWIDYSYDLSSYKGKNIRLGFRLKSDGSHHYGGWFIDDVTVVNVGDPTATTVALAPAIVYGGYAAGSALITAGVAYYTYLQVQNVITDTSGATTYDFGNTQYQGKLLDGPRDVLIIWDATNPNISEQEKQLAFLLNTLKYHLQQSSQLAFGVYDGTDITLLNNQVYSGPQVVQGGDIDFPFYDAVATEVEELKAGTLQRSPTADVYAKLFDKIYRDNNNDSDPEPDPEKEAYRVLQDQCLNTFLLTSVSDGLAAAGSGLTQLGSYMEGETFKMFVLASGTDPGNVDTSAVSTMAQATGGYLAIAAEIVDDAVAANPAEAAKEKMCGGDGIQLQFFGSSTKDDDFVGVDGSILDGQLTYRGSSSSITVVIEGAGIKFGLFDDLNYLGPITNAVETLELTVNSGETSEFFLQPILDLNLTFTMITVKDKLTGELLLEERIEITEDPVLFRAISDVDIYPAGFYDGHSSGIVTPTGWESGRANIVPEVHINDRGRGLSIFTSWSFSYLAAYQSMSTSGNNSVLIKRKFKNDEIISATSRYDLEDQYSRREVLIIGSVEDCFVKDITR